MTHLQESPVTDGRQAANYESQFPSVGTPVDLGRVNPRLYSLRLMNMPRIIFVFAVIFVVLGIASYLLTGAQSWTALIPAIFGLLLAIAGGVSLKNLKHGGHIAALVGLLGFFGTARSLGKVPALLSGEPVERAAAVGVQAVFAVLCLIFIALCVKSFIDARRARTSGLS
jgi:hypothetical protein